MYIVYVRAVADDPTQRSAYSNPGDPGEHLVIDLETVMLKEHRSLLALGWRELDPLVQHKTVAGAIKAAEAAGFNVPGVSGIGLHSWSPEGA